MPERKVAYAAGTNVTVIRSKEEIRKTVERFGAIDFATRENPRMISILFVTPDVGDGERRVRMTLFLPAQEAEQFWSVRTNNTTAGLRRRTPAQAKAAYDAEIQRRWRSLATSIKGKLIAVEDGVETIDEAFWAHVVLPNGHTIYEETHAPVAEAYLSGAVGRLLPEMEAQPRHLQIEGVKGK